MEQEEKLAQKLMPKLIEVASNESWISYSEIADFLGIDLGNPDDRWQLMGQVMQKVNDITVPQGYLLTSVIVHKGRIGTRTEPGDGYFLLAREVGFLTTENPFQFWGMQLQKCHNKHSNRRK